MSSERCEHPATPKGTDSALFDHAAFGDAGSGIDRKHLRIYRIERLCSLHVLRQLQLANLCDHLECRCVCKDDCYSADFDVPDEPVCSDEQAEPVPVEIHSSGLETASEEKAFRLNSKIGILKRFRIRVIFQNLPNYITIVIGILFANFILMFGFMFEPMLDHFQEQITSNMIADYQYLLKAPQKLKMQMQKNTVQLL